jgi:lysyl-tRNA synthetase class 1
VPDATLPLTYGLLLNLVSLPGVADKDTAWKFVQRYAPGTSPETDPELDELIGLAVNYARDFVAPTLQRRAAGRARIDALRDLDAELEKLDPRRRRRRSSSTSCSKSASATRSKPAPLVPGALRNPARLSQGPRMGSFIALYGIDNSRR